MLQELLGTWVGQLSLFVIVFVIVMAAYLLQMTMRKMAEDAKAAGEEE